MFHLETLKNDFARARVPLRVESRPFVAGVRSDAIVQLDVQRRKDRGEPREEIRLYPGKGTQLSVIGVEPKVRQLVLRVQEPFRTFRERVFDRNVREMVWTTRTTSNAVRRFLVGEDESHLFVAQLSIPATSVEEAHDTLRPRELGGRKNVRRQGEWFFVPATREEQELVRKRLRMGRVTNARIGAHLRMRGRPHVADELVQLRYLDGRLVELARGRVRHPDHAVLELKDWARIVMNTEDRSVGATWVD
jgi:hypothetical protein